MARRKSDEFDPFDDEMFGKDLESVDLDALRLEVDNLSFDDDEDDAPVPEPRSSRMSSLRRRSGSERPPKPRSARTGTPIRIVPLIVGLFQVIIYAVIALALFLAIGFGIVYAGQQLGYIPQRAATSAAAAGAPTAVAVAPTSAAEQPVVVPTQPPPPTATPDLGCPSAATWWNNSQIQNAYVYFTGQALNDARGSSRITALITQMTIRRDFVANYRMNGDPNDPCLDPLRADLLRGFDATISAARIINTDTTSAAEQQANAEQAYADLFDALRALGVTVDAATPAS